MFTAENLLRDAPEPAVSARVAMPGATRLSLQTVAPESATYSAVLQGSIDGRTWVDLVEATNRTPYVGYGGSGAAGKNLVVRYVRVDLRAVSGDEATVSAHVVGC